MAMNVGELVAYLSLDDSKYRKALASANKAALGFGKAIAGAGAGIAGLGAGVQVIGGIAAVASTAAGALLLLPAAAGAAKFGMAALQVATSGFGDAMSSMDDPAAFAAAIAELSPAAAAAATAVRDLKPAWDAMADSVQERMFAGLADEVTALGTTYMPILGDSFGRVADAANGAGAGVAEMLRESARIADVTTLTDRFASVWENLLPAVAPLGGALLDIGVVGAGALNQLTDGATGAAREFGAFIAQARQSGQLALWIHEGINALKMLGEVAGNIGEILGGIFRAADVGGASFLERLVTITQQIANMINSVEGQATLTTFFQTAATLSGLFMEALNALLPVLPPLVAVLGTLAVNIGTLLVAALTAIAPYLETFALWLQENPGLVTAAAVAIGGLIVAANGLLGLIKVINVVKTIWNSGLLQMAARVIATSVVFVGRMAFMAVQALLHAGRMAAAWLIAMGPIGWIIAAVVGLVALIILNWDKVSAWTAKAWAAVSGFVSEAWSKIVSWVTTKIAQAVAVVTNGWNSAVTWTKNAWSNLTGAVRSGIDSTVNWVRDLPGKILGIIRGLGSQLATSGRAIIDDFLGGIKHGWDVLMGWVRGGLTKLRNLWPFSPAKDGPFSGSGYVTHSGKALTGDFAKSLQAGMPGVIASARQLMDAAHLEMSAPTVGGPPALPGPRPGERLTGGAPGVTIQINNPQAERSSDAIGRAGSVLAAIGPWGDE